MYSLGISLVVIVVGSIARCIIFGVPRLPIRPCDDRPPAMYGHFCLIPRVSVHDRYYCSVLFYQLFFHQVFNHARSNSLAKFNKYLTDIWYNETPRKDHMKSWYVTCTSPGVELCISPLDFLFPYTPDCIKKGTRYTKHSTL